MTAEIITFYSYKGGTGRSMHLANVAWILASNGKRVLMIDWDLEAPGLHRYFRPFLVDKDLAATEGLIDLLWDFNAAAMESVPPAERAKGWHEAYADLSAYTVAIDWPFPVPGCLDLVPSGKQGPSYSGNVNSFNWKRFYDDLGGGVFLESVKDRMRPEYDYVLIDSRTGVSDSAGVCTVQMPDALVVCFTGNNQSIDGCASVMESVRAQWSSNGRWPDRNRILPLLTRIDGFEKAKLDARRALARATFQPYVAAIPVSIDDYWRDIEVPYKPWYSYEEVLAVFGDRYKENSSLLASAEALTRILTRGSVTEVVPPGDADRERVIAQFAVTEKVREPIAAQGGVEFHQASPPQGAPAPLIDFTVERQRHARFVGREDVLTRLDEWLLGPDEVGWVVVTGGPGMGKSAIMSAWLARREAAGAVVPHHFIRRQVANWDQPEVIAASLATQIEAVFPDLRDPAARPEGRLIELLGRVSKRLGASDRLVVVVDGLDEVAAEPGDNPLPRFLPHVVPPGIRFLCAMRPMYPHLSWIEARASIQRLDLDDRPWAASNETVVRGLWETAAEDEPRLSAEVIATAVERAEGNVLYTVMLHDALQNSPAPERRVDRIPRGIQGLISEIWDRAAMHEDVRAGLGLLCAAQEALPLDVIAELAGWGPDHYEKRARFLREARQLLLEEPGSWPGVVAYSLHHNWVRALIAERLGGATVRAHHGELSRKLATWPVPAEPTARRYALRHGLIHRVEASAWADAWRLAADTSFLEAKCRELGADEAEADVARAAERCRVSGNEALRGRFNDLARALGRETHWLRAAPEATAALVWNRLRQSGWSADEIGQQLQLPAEATFLRVQHLATGKSSALVGDHVGHADKVNACAVTPDGRCVVSASGDNTLKVWDLESGQALATLQGHADRVRACAVTPDGRRVVSASWDNTLKVWDLDSGQALATLRGHAAGVNACAVTPDGQRVVSASWDNTLKVWDLDSGQALATLQGHAAGGSACAVTPDGRRVVSASEDKTLKVWNLDSGQALVTLQGHADRVRACMVTPDGRRVVSASEDRTLKVWDLDSGQALATLQGHADRVLACTVTPDGRRVVSGSEDKTLKVWDLASGKCLLTHYANSSYFAVAATTTAIVAGDAAGAVWFLDWPWSNRSTRSLRTGSAPEPPRRSHSDNEVLAVPGGAMAIHDPLYIRRQGDDDADALAKSDDGQTLIIKGPQQHGKSSLLIRYLATRRTLNKKIGLIDFETFSGVDLESYPEFLTSLATAILDVLEISAPEPKIRRQMDMNRFLQRTVLEVTGPLVIAFDEVDRVANRTYRTDFFSMLRSWHNSRALSPAWQTVDLALVLSTEPDLLIQDSYQSPFNVGQTIELDCFTREQCHAMNARCAPRQLSRDEVDEIYELLGGHPYLTRLAYHRVLTGSLRLPLDLRVAGDPHGPFGDHLRGILSKLSARPALLAALQRIIRDRRAEPDLVHRLRSIGLVRTDGGIPSPANLLYTTFFGSVQ